MRLEVPGFTGARTPAERGIAVATSDPSSALVAEADPAYRRDSVRVHRVVREVEHALQATADPIVVSGRSGCGKAGLLRALWWSPPSGFIPVFVPIADVEPDEPAGDIISAGRRISAHDGLSAMARLLRPQDSNAANRLLLVDELQTIPLSRLTEWVAIMFAPRTAPRLVATGTDGDELESAVAALHRSTRRIHFDSEGWARAEYSAEADVLTTPLRASAMSAEKRARMMRRRHRRLGLGWI